MPSTIKNENFPVIKQMVVVHFIAEVKIFFIARFFINFLKKLMLINYRLTNLKVISFNYKPRNKIYLPIFYSVV